MDYIGSKAKLLDWIFGHAERHMQILGIDPAKSTFLDACMGTGAVTFKALMTFQKVIALDLLAFPAVRVNGLTTLTEDEALESATHLELISGLEGIEGFFYREYSPAGNRMYLTEDNAKRVDATRQYIESVRSPRVRAYLLYCGIEAMSRVLNTAGTQGAYLKHWQDKALNPYFPKDEILVAMSADVTAMQDDILVYLDHPGRAPEDVLYIDPPYNNRQYGPNYHLYDTFVMNDNPRVKGVTGLRPYPRSTFSGKAEDVADLIREIMKRTTAKLVLISYSSDGTLSRDEMEQCMLEGFQHTEMEIQVRAYKRYKADASDDRTYSDSLLREYLFIIRHRPEQSGLNDLW